MSNIQSDTKLAIELEEKGYVFYKEITATTSNPLASSTFFGLADRELIHIERIKELYKMLTGKKSLKTDWLKGIEIPATKAELIKPILNRLKTSLNREFAATKDINDAYAIAEGLEKDSFTLYDKLSGESADETIKKFYEALAQEEREHYTILDETLEYLNNPGEWYRLKERWIVEGG